MKTLSLLLFFCLAGLGAICLIPSSSLAPLSHPQTRGGTISSLSLHRIQYGKEEEALSAENTLLVLNSKGAVEFFHHPHYLGAYSFDAEKAVVDYRDKHLLAKNILGSAGSAAEVEMADGHFRLKGPFHFASSKGVLEAEEGLALGSLPLRTFESFTSTRITLPSGESLSAPEGVSLLPDRTLVTKGACALMDSPLLSIQAHTIQIDPNHTIDCTEEVILVRKDKNASATADHLIYIPSTQQGIIRSNVYYTQEEEQLELRAEEIHFSPDSLQAIGKVKGEAIR